MSHESRLWQRGIGQALWAVKSGRLFDLASTVCNDCEQEARTRKTPTGLAMILLDTSEKRLMREIFSLGNEARPVEDPGTYELDKSRFSMDWGVT